MIRLLAATAAVAFIGAAPSPTLHVRVFAHTGVRLTDVVWTGTRFVYVENTTNRLFAGGPRGGKPGPLASLPRLVEETRCAVAPAGGGFAAGAIYCHVPDNRIYRISPDGRTIRLFASLPTRVAADGMLAFDTVGRFGRWLVVATGRSGSGRRPGGTVYAIDARGTVRRIGSYAGPGGADEVAIAPRGFGAVAGWALLTVDAGAAGGSIVAVGPGGETRTLARLPDGPNPIAVVPASAGRSAAEPGCYLVDTNTTDVFLLPATELAPYAGDVLVGTEIRGQLWLVRSAGVGYVTRRLRTDLRPAAYDLEGAACVP